MNTFSIVRDSLAKSEDDPTKVGLAESVIEAGRVLAAVQTVVDALTPPTGGRWIVAFADIPTAGTSLGEQRITISSKPLRDRDLSLIEKAVVMATFAAHEIGHTYVTRPRKQPVNLIAEHNQHSGFQSVSNIADDIILEPFMTERFPILADAFEFTGGWVLRTTAKSLPHRDTLNRETTTAERFNIIVHATRYGDIPEIEWNAENVRAERDWARDWAQRLLALPLLDHAAFLAACDEVWDRVRTVDTTEPEPEPEPLGGSPDGTNPEPTDEQGDEPGDEAGNEPGQGEGPEDKPGNDFDEDTDEDGEPGEGESDDEGDGEGDGEPGDDKGEGDGEPGDGDGEPESESEGGEGDEPTPGGESNGGDWDGSKDDSDHDGDDEPEGDDEYTGHETGSGPDDDEAGGGGDAEADGSESLRDEDDFDQREVDETTHDSAEQSDWTDENNERAARTYDATTATAFGIHGSMTTTWE